jgi:hypothetical protein
MARIQEFGDHDLTVGQRVRAACRIDNLPV